jgi:hypothetical protein
MTKNQNSKPVYDLEERIFQFAKAVRLFVRTLPKTIANVEDGKQFNLNFSKFGNWKLDFEICLLFVFWSLLFEERVNSAY